MIDIILLLPESVLMNSTPVVKFAGIHAHKVPPLSVTSIDVTALLRQVTLPRNEVEETKFLHLKTMRHER